MDDELEQLKRLDWLRAQHRELDDEINHINDEFARARLKKEKLKLRDQIVMLESFVYPDMPA